MAENKGKSIWDKMNNDPRIGSFFQIIVHLNHYLYALNQLRSVTSDVPSMSTPSTFYMECLWNMIGNWFAVKSKTSSYLLKSALLPLGLEKHLKPLDELLDSPIGNTTWRVLVKEFRNAQGTHEIFSGDVQKQVYAKYGITQDQLGIPMSEIVRKTSDFFINMGKLIGSLQAQVELAFCKYDREYYMVLRQRGFYHTVLDEADITS